MYAVVLTGGKQYKMVSGETVDIEKLDVAVGSNVKFDKILLVGDTNDVKVGKPTVDGVTVDAEVVMQDRDKKVLVFKKKKRKGYKKIQGHRQFFTRVKVVNINA